jgi:glycosyltransferase involved in cell wall biosynthesis
MNLVIYVHEFKPEVGHSRAMIELVNGLSPETLNRVNSIEVVAFECKDLNSLFPQFQGKKIRTILPFGQIKPFLFKALMFNVISLIHSLTKSKEYLKISIGIANWNADIVNIQFLHTQWEDTYFKTSNMSLYKKIYKRVLFSFFSFGENLLYRDPSTRFISIAQFISQSLVKDYGVNSKNIHLIPSGINCEEFKLSGHSSADILQSLILKYPQLSGLSLEKPVVLFVGAFERKGLDRALNILKSKKNFQLLVIGKPEAGSHFSLPDSKHIFHVPFTDTISKFYEISDLFIFPTRYEPFGLVIIEAFAMGLDVIVPNENVGASEVISQDEGVIFFAQNDSDEQISNLFSVKKISSDEKLKRIEKRMPILKSCSWINAGNKFQSMLFKN